MKALIKFHSVLLALAVTTACGTKAKDQSAVASFHSNATSVWNDQSWIKVGESNAFGGAIGGALTLPYAVNNVFADEVAIAYSSTCTGISAAKADVLLPGQGLAPTQYNDIDTADPSGMNTSMVVMYFAINGNAAATISGVNTTFFLAPGTACETATYIHPIGAVPF